MPGEVFQGEDRQPYPHPLGIIATLTVDLAVGVDPRLEQLGRPVCGKGEDRPAQLTVAERRGIADRRTPTGDLALHRLGPDGDTLTLEERGIIDEVIKLFKDLGHHM